MGRHGVVIGAGIVGLFVARELLADGWEVTVVEGDQHSGTSAGNAGMIVPSHFVPLASPGMLRAGFRMMGRKGAPLRLKWDGSSNSTRWILGYLAHANRRHVAASADPLLALSLDAKRRYESWARERGDIDLGDQGLLMVSRTEQSHSEEADVAREGERLGLDVAVLDGDAARGIEPTLGENVVGAVHFRDDACLTPTQVLAALRMELGPHITFAKAMGWVKTHGSVSALRTDQGEVSADKFVVAMGASSVPLLREAGCPLTLLPGRGYGITLDPDPSAMPRVPALLIDDRVSVTPMIDGLRVTGGMEIGVWDEPIDQARLESLRRGLAAHYPELTELPWDRERVWRGWRPLSPDGLPYIGEALPGSNVYVATGHGMMGVSLAPATGAMIAAMIEGREPSVDPKPFHPRRML
ncbi:MAG: FAD-dependent oxidoreductase [Fimbriimonadaceae bacterium]|nr:FAD-dependent oxidoreductase [Fimbriimonadaceae bacterium]